MSEQVLTITPYILREEILYFVLSKLDVLLSLTATSVYNL